MPAHSACDRCRPGFYRSCVGKGLAVRRPLAVRPVTLYLLGPISISFPGIKRRIDAGASTARCGCFGNPPAILLPPVRIWLVPDTLIGLAVDCCRILFPFGASIVRPCRVFVVLHKRLLFHCLGQMLRCGSSGAQELHHNATRLFSF